MDKEIEKNASVSENKVEQESDKDRKKREKEEKVLTYGTLFYSK